MDIFHNRYLHVRLQAPPLALAARSYRNCDFQVMPWERRDVLQSLFGIRRPLQKR